MSHEISKTDKVFAVRQPTWHGLEVSELQVQTINVVFDGPPSHESGRFIEVENLDGASIKAGEWVQLDSERWALQLDVVTIK